MNHIAYLRRLFRLCWDIQRPNITGEVFIGKGGNFGNGSYAKSAFSVVNRGGGNNSGTNDFGGTVIKFSADKSNSTYANNHLQPAAFQTLIIIKI